MRRWRRTAWWNSSHRPTLRLYPDWPPTSPGSGCAPSSPSLPRDSSTTVGVQPLVDLDQDLDISHTHQPAHSPGLINILNKNLSKMISTRRYRAHKGKMEDYHMEAKAEDTVYLLERPHPETRPKVFNMGLYVNVRSLDPTS